MSFHYSSPQLGKEFHANLYIVQCEGTKKDGTQCSRQVTVGLPYCTTHLDKILGLRIGPSTIPNAGDGVFATKNIAKGQWVCPYDGEILRGRDIDERYGLGEMSCAVYALQRSADVYVDAAIYRSVGSMINHSRRRENVAFDIDSRKLLYLRALKNIKAGSELFVDYGLNYAFNHPIIHHTSKKRLRE